MILLIGYQITIFCVFSFHEIALFDVSANIDYILNETNQSSIVYIGHSMGTLTSYILLSVKPEYNQKMKLVISLSPVVYWDKKTPAINFLIGISPRLKVIYYLLTIINSYFRNKCAVVSAIYYSFLQNISINSYLSVDNISCIYFRI